MRPINEEEFSAAQAELATQFQAILTKHQVAADSFAAGVLTSGKRSAQEITDRADAAVSRMHRSAESMAVRFDEVLGGVAVISSAIEASPVVIQTEFEGTNRHLGSLVTGLFDVHAIEGFALS